ncbi:MAG: SDR family oxidoreductase [Candidatus Eremiobacteraeota bacterium]|nr:SDR family oxidoreductase [Candidatus Eremiobacteraeota bacterium]MBV8355189.1 SDR family oxidoreductase [Candidatus Eremiobacteraeota bacterium]
MNQIDLRGRRAVITGGARGIGLAVAQRLAVSGAGALTLWDRDREALERAKPTFGNRLGVSTAVVDVTDAAGLERAAQAALAGMGGIDVLVTSAGITGPNATTWEYPVDAWRSVIEINLTGIFLSLRAVVPIMRAARYGRIVNIASVAGKDGNPNAAAYSAAKAGVIGLTKSLGKELVHDGVIVNCVTPAAIETEMFAQMTRAHIDYMLSKIPMGRFGRAEEVAALIAWLCSEDCSFSTAGVFDISGGRSTY